MIEIAADDVAVLLEEASPLSAARAGWGERGEIELDTGLVYALGKPVRVHVRKRGGPATSSTTSAARWPRPPSRRGGCLSRSAWSSSSG